jgi:hypothetical protein
VQLSPYFSYDFNHFKSAITPGLVEPIQVSTVRLYRVEGQRLLNSGIWVSFDHLVESVHPGTVVGLEESAIIVETRIGGAYCQAGEVLVKIGDGLFESALTIWLQQHLYWIRSTHLVGSPST